MAFVCEETGNKSGCCEKCGGTFKLRNLSGKARKGFVKENRFCSRACSAASVRLYTSRSEKKRAEKNRRRVRDGMSPLPSPAESAICVVCNNRFKPRTYRTKVCSRDCSKDVARRRAAQSYVPVVHTAKRQCRECGKGYVPDHGARVYCGDRCSTRAVKRISRKRERARLRLAKVESVNPTVVFDRDGWQCQLCGIKTPRRLRGTFDPQAPELDHIVPLAIGGDHSYRNTQCSCRACNHRKGARPLGQTRLFG